MRDFPTQHKEACQFVNLEKTDSDITAQTEGWKSLQRIVAPRVIKI